MSIAHIRGGCLGCDLVIFEVHKYSFYGHVIKILFKYNIPKNYQYRHVAAKFFGYHRPHKHSQSNLFFIARDQIYR